MSNFNMGKEEIPSGAIIDNRYRIQTILGQGGLGRTYLAFDIHRFNESCVLKEFAPFGSRQDDLEKSCNLFKREAQILHRITHPQIPKFLACFESHERLFLVQEFVNGKNYSALLQERQRKNQAFSEQEIIKWLIDVLPILDYIHERGIIHRDISPDNIMQPKGEELPVLIDFGVGKLTNTAQDSGKPGTRSHSYVGKMSFVGKVGYAAVEQISMGRCSPSSDIYSLGVTALVLLTGKDPTSLLNQDSLEWQWQKYIQVSPGFAQFISKMVEARPLKRYQSAQETLKELEKYFADIDTFIQRTNQEKVTASKSQSKLVTAKSSDQRKLQKHSHTSNTSKLNPIFPQTPRVQNEESEISALDKYKEIAEPVKNDDNGEETIILNLNKTNSTSEKKTPQSPPKLSEDEPQNYSMIDNTIIVSPSHSNSLEVENQEINYHPLEPKFVSFCNQELAYFIGPMANLIIEETLTQNKFSSPESFVEALAQQIPNLDLRIKFKRRFL